MIPLTTSASRPASNGNPSSAPTRTRGESWGAVEGHGFCWEYQMISDRHKVLKFHRRLKPDHRNQKMLSGRLARFNPYKRMSQSLSSSVPTMNTHVQQDVIPPLAAPTVPGDGCERTTAAPATHVPYAGAPVASIARPSVAHGVAGLPVLPRTSPPPIALTTGSAAVRTTAADLSHVSASTVAAPSDALLPLPDAPASASTGTGRWGTAPAGRSLDGGRHSLQTMPVERARVPSSPHLHVDAYGESARHVHSTAPTSIDAGELAQWAATGQSSLANALLYQPSDAGQPRANSQQSSTSPVPTTQQGPERNEAPVVLQDFFRDVDYYTSIEYMTDELARTWFSDATLEAGAYGMASQAPTEQYQATLA
ncbi:hypothetical protein C8T65DRAFT_700583 [Cerioporus squamosus]|nr:hypothetical protein C8T65DRAFT_700583 [Cerioporus squamosus]